MAVNAWLQIKVADQQIVEEKIINKWRKWK
jgi:hypothetical protein